MTRLRISLWACGLFALSLTFLPTLAAGRPAPALAPPAPPILSETVSINGLHGWTAAQGNHLKLFDVALDENLNRIYVQGILTAGIAVIDGATDTLIGSLSSGGSDNDFNRPYLAVHPTNGMLYMAGYGNHILRRIDPATNTVTAQGSLAADPVGVIVDAATNRVFVSLQTTGEVAVYDATTLALLATVDLGADRIGGLDVDSAAQRLYVVHSSAPTAATPLYVINTATLAQLPSLTVNNAGGAPFNFVDVDPASGRLFLTTSNRLFILNSSGAQLASTLLPADAKQPRFWTATGKVYVVSRDGISPIRSSLSVLDASTGALEQQLDLQTGGAQRMVLNRTTGKIYTAGMEYTQVAVVNALTVSLNGLLDIGNAVEDVAVAPTDGTVYLTNRLGGSTLMIYRPGSGAWNELTTGGWPTAVDVDTALNRLFVLSHYDGAVTAYALAPDPLNPTLLGSVNLGLTDTEDALSNQTVDSTHHRVITTHPERDRVVIVDGSSLSVAATISDVPSFTYSPQGTAGPGHLQPAVDESLNKLYVLVSRQHKVDVFDGNANYAYLRTLDLSSQQWGWSNAFADHVIFADSSRHRLHIGPILIDTTTDTVTGLLPAGRGSIVVDLDAANNRLLTLDLATTGAQAAVRGPRLTGRLRQPAGAAASVWRLYTIDASSFSLISQTDLRSLTYVPPYTGLDASRQRFIAGYMQRAEVDIYGLDGAAATSTPTATVGAPTATPTRTPTAVGATATPTRTPTATAAGPTATPTATPDETTCVVDVNGNGIGDIVDIMGTTVNPACHSYLPIVASRWNLSWPGATPTTTPSSTPTRTPTNAPGSTATPTPTGSHGVDPHWGPEHQATFSTHIASGVVGRNLAVDAANRLHIMWGEINGTVYDALYSRSTDGGVTWSSPLDVANSTFPATGPNLVIGPDGTLHSMWHDRRSGGADRLYYSRSTDAGLSWGAPRDLTGASTRKVGSFSFSLDLQNRLHLAWHYGDPSSDTTPTEIYYMRSTDGGSTFGARQKLNQGSGHAAFPRFSVEGVNGNLLAIAWRDNRANPDWDTYVAVSTDGGQTFAERVGAATAERDWDPEAIVDTSGVIHLGIMTTHPPHASVDYRRSTDQGQSWSVSVTLSEANSRFPFWAPDNPHGVIWLFWKDERDFLTPACPEPERCADIAGKYSSDGGLTWSAQEFVTDLESVEVKFPSLIVGPDGRPHALWSDRRTGSEVENLYVRSRLSAP
ncbi:MAG: exo-alpha-sialidase [Anaerolineae bacterium]